MRNRLTALNVLLLLGFISQGFSWENYYMPALYAFVWFLCMYFHRPKRFIPELAEIIIFGIGLIIAVATCRGNPFTASLYIGNVLFIFQAIRLLSPLRSIRTKLMAASIALTHLSIGSMVILDYTFILILGLAIVLVPKVFYDIDHARYSDQEKPIFDVVYGKKAILCIGLTMVLFFLFFPRQRVMGPAGSGLMIRRRMMNSQLDTSSSTAGGSDEVVFQIQGENIGYLKTHALGTFDGNTWKASEITNRFERALIDYDQDKNLYRQVTTKNSRLFNNVLPTDGYVKYLRGNFFHKSYVTIQDNVVISFGWNNTNPTYEYWIEPDHKNTQPLKKWQEKHYLRLPSLSKKVVDYVNNVVGKTKDPYKVARKLESHLRNSFKYELGIPSLNRFNPIEDFLLNEKRGHCERFASALAVMLRLKHIPSRVVIGYFPSQKNQFADFYNVRVKDGHAWTEAFIEGRGWTILDGTPYLETNQGDSFSFIMSVYDWIEFFWYTKIVNYSYSDQNMFLSTAIGILRGVLGFVTGNRESIGLLAGLLIVLALLIKFKRKSDSSQEESGCENEKKRVRQLREIRHFYGQLLKILEKHGVFRSVADTPYEFLEELKGEELECFGDIQFITRQFCMVKYGNQELTDTAKQEINTKIRELRKSLF